MALDNAVEEYRRYTLVARLHKGTYRGNARVEGKMSFELEGTSVEDVLVKLRDGVNANYSLRIDSVAPTPQVSVYIDAFKKILGKINDAQFAMLRAHFHAPDRCLSPLALAEAADYKDIGGVNLWYGFLGQWLFESMTVSVPLMLDGNGLPVYTSALASYIPDPGSPEGPAVWKMHDEVAAAIAELGLDK